MKKRIILLIVCVLVFSFGYTKIKNINEEEVQIQLPTFDFFVVTDFYFVTENEILLNYHKYGNDSSTKIVLLDLVGNDFSILYEGEQDFTNGIFLNKKNTYILQNGEAQLTFDSVNEQMKINLSNSAENIISFYNPYQNITVQRTKEGTVIQYPEETYKIEDNSGISLGYKFNKDGSELIYISDYMGFCAFDFRERKLIKFKGNESFELPKQLVDYLDINYTTDEKNIILLGACENNNVYQIIDKENGNLIAQYVGETNNTRLLDVNEKSLILFDGQNDNSKIVQFNYENSEKLSLLDIEDGAMFCGKLNDSKTKLVLITGQSDNQYIIIKNMSK